MLTEVGPCLGRGSTAAVYRCSRPDFAAKIFSGRDNVARARHEATILRLVAPHAHVVGVVGAFFSETRACIALQLAAGCLLDLPQPVLTRQQVTIARQLAIALRHVHSVGVAHMDVKPDNLLYLWQRDEVLRLLLSDFDLSKRLGSSNASDGGTPLYAAPEIFVKDRRVSPMDGSKADAWSAAVTVWGVASGRLPWKIAHPVCKEYRAFARCADVEAWVAEHAPALHPSARAFVVAALRLRAHERALLVVGSAGGLPDSSVPHADGGAVPAAAAGKRQEMPEC